MFASGPLYTSGAFIGWVTIGVAVIVGVSAYVMWLFGIPRRKLWYSAEITSLIATSPVEPDPKLRVVYDGTALTDPYLITLRLVSRSRRDIGNDDFNGGDPLVFDLQAPIVAALGATSVGLTSPRGPGVGTSFRVRPRKISRGEVLRLDLLTEGRPRLSPPQNPLLNVNVIDEDRWSRRRPLVGGVIGLTGFACLVAAGVITLVDPHGPRSGREAVAIVGGALL